MSKAKDPKRSAAAKRGWENRRRREKTEARFKRSLAARKGWASRKVKAAEKLPPDRQVAELLARINELESINKKQKEIIERQNRRLEKRKEKIERLAHAIKRIKKPYAIEMQEAIKRDREGSDRGIYLQVERLREDGRGVFQALYEVWEEVHIYDEYEDLADVREAWFDEYLEDTG